MKKYENMKWEEMIDFPIEEYDKIPKDCLEKAIDDFKKRSHLRNPILVKDVPID